MSGGDYGSNGDFGQGARGGFTSGGGGGGWYGGASGGSNSSRGCGIGGGGGAGSSYTTSNALDMQFFAGYRFGAGMARIAWPPSAMSDLPVPSSPTSYAYTGSPQIFFTPGEADKISVALAGGSGNGGGLAGGGSGGVVNASFRSVPGQPLLVFVGEGGKPGPRGGWNGGGNASSWPTSDGDKRGAGGGATDIRVGGWLPSDRVLVAGGGGGASVNSFYGSPANGGAGGGITGGAGQDGKGCSRPEENWKGGGGGTQTEAGQTYVGYSRGAHGPDGAEAGFGGGGGGGGWFGGGAGGGDSTRCASSSEEPSASAGGGGSGYAATTAMEATFTGGNGGDGWAQFGPPSDLPPPPPPAPPAPVPCDAPASVRACEYVALGDSFASGEGTSPFDPLTDRPGNFCHRSLRAGAVLFAQNPGPGLPPLSLIHKACSGAVIADVWRGKYGEGSQLSALSPSTSLVSISIGGNDLHFANVLKTCAVTGKLKQLLTTRSIDSLKLGTLGNVLKRLDLADLLTKALPFPDCEAYWRPVVAKARRTITNGQEGSLQQLYREIEARTATDGSPAPLLVVGYPYLFPKENQDGNCYGISASAQRWINDAVDTGNDSIMHAARREGAIFVDLREGFRDHGLCDRKRNYINGIRLSADALRPLLVKLLEHKKLTAQALVGAAPFESFHPNPEGQKRIAEALQQANSERSVPTPVLLVGTASAPVKADTTGTVTIPGASVECPAEGRACRVETEALASVRSPVKRRAGAPKARTKRPTTNKRRITVRLAASDATVAPGTTRPVRIRLSKRGLSVLEKSKRLRVIGTIRVTRRTTTITEPISFTLRKAFRGSSRG